eukprot:6205148-Pleurochrysis_carterae.AAC.3
MFSVTIATCSASRMYLECCEVHATETQYGRSLLLVQTETNQRMPMIAHGKPYRGVCPVMRELGGMQSESVIENPASANLVYQNGRIQ